MISTGTANIAPATVATSPIASISMAALNNTFSTHAIEGGSNRPNTAASSLPLVSGMRVDAQVDQRVNGCDEQEGAGDGARESVCRPRRAQCRAGFGARGAGPELT